MSGVPAPVQPSVQVVDGHLPREAGRRITEVVVGVLVDAAGPAPRYLLTTRPAGKAYAGYWEFPGGKVEAGESVEQALVRELREEIGITATGIEPWRVDVVDYPHALVRLNICRVTAWMGQLMMREGQQFAWQGLPVAVSPVLPGTVPILARLQSMSGEYIP